LAEICTLSALVVTVIITSTLLVWYQEKHPPSWQKMFQQPSKISLSLLAKAGKTEKGRVQVCMYILLLRSCSQLATNLFPRELVVIILLIS